ncbi:diacylglycerol kinase family lipid kinase [Emticicia sediminis]
MTKIAFIIHGKARKKQFLIDEIKRIFEAPFFQTQILETQFEQHAILLAESAVAEGFSYIIACGGDGTLNEVLNGILKTKREDIKLGIIPKGSGNDFVKTICSPASLSALKASIIEQKTKQIDVGLAEFVSKEGQPTFRYFINIADVGIGGAIAQQLAEVIKIFGSVITYQYFIFKNFLTYRPQQIKVIGDDFEYSGNIMNFCAANAKYFGSGLGIAPTANIADGMLNAVAIGEVSLLDYLKNFPDLKKCKPLKHPAIKYFTSKTLFFESTNQFIPIDMDGEFVGFLPMKITVKPQAINFII